MVFDYKAIEDTIGYAFSDKNLLLQAFTHKSFSNEHKGFLCYERLEFLGDSVLGFIVTEYLFKNYLIDEGALTTVKSKLVSTVPLSTALKAAGLDRYVLSGNGTDCNDKIKEDVFEALIGATYLDGGLKNAEMIVNNLLLSSSELNKAFSETRDYKSIINVFAERKRLGDVKYVEVSRSGPDHDPVFTMALMIGNDKITVGEGSTKQKAEQNAAKKAVYKLKSEGQIIEF